VHGIRHPRWTVSGISDMEGIMKVKVYKNGNSASIEKNGCWHVVKCRIGTELYDRVMVDDARMARDYFKAFCAIAKNR
jgi:hypothetical protein